MYREVRLMEYIGKSDKESIIDHEKNLLEQERVLYNTYPQLANSVSLSTLAYIAKLHDTGKLNSLFQQKMKDVIEGKQVFMEDGEMPHPVFSACFVDKDLFFSEDEYKTVEAAVLYHHGLRNFDKVGLDELRKQLLTIEAGKDFWGQLGLSVPTPHLPDLSLTKMPNAKSSWYHMFVIYIGLLHRLDYSASGHYQVEYPNGNLYKQVRRYFHRNNLLLNDMQLYLQKHDDNSIILRAQTGMGKTEGALLWGKSDKTFFTLPLRSAINSIYYRIRQNYAVNEEDVGELHSTAALFLQDKNIDSGMYALAKRLSLPVTVTTPDQVFRFIFPYAGSSLYMATLAYSKVVVDEIQQYSASTLGYLLWGLRLVQLFGGKFLVMSATIYPFVTSIASDLGLEFQLPEPYVDKKLNRRHYVKTYHQLLKCSNITDIYKGKKTLVIVNTVRRAQQLYLELKALGYPVHLFHSRYTNMDRSIIEDKLVHAGPKDIWITTQVAEASLDLDFDCGIFELADLSSLFQRMGRVYRKRNFYPNQNQKYNIHVFLGPDSYPTERQATGAGYVYDIDLLKLSRQALVFVKGLLSEDMKNKLIDGFFSLDKIKKTSYYEKVLKAVRYAKLSYGQQFERKEALSYFRNISTLDIIPYPVYEQYKDKIDKAFDDLKRGTGDKRIKGRVEFNKYLVGVYPDSVKESKRNFVYKVGNGETYPVVDVNYNSEIGIN